MGDENERGMDLIALFFLVAYQNEIWISVEELEGIVDNRRSFCILTTMFCKRVLALPMHPYMEEEEQDMVIEAVRENCRA